ncbi:MAG: mechanosensitive ion channel family protein [Deltaproteobacteria bacterium]|nr:MAG: mechanosensitive ion channel family protein [Deltaproteobacteria bacterium]
MEELWTDVTALFSTANLMVLLRVVIVLAVGWIVGRGIELLVGRVMRSRGPHAAQILRRLVRYVLLALTLVAAFTVAGVDVGVLLGAAGVVTIAVGFAAQSSAANAISGFFLLGERAFEVGDTISVGETVGEVLSVDLMSVKLRTFDNLFVRIPNESLLKTELRNLSRFPIRRLDLALTVGYGEDFERVRSILSKVAWDNTDVLDEPKPIILFTGFGDNGYTVQYSVWAARERFLSVKASLHAEVVAALREAQIAIPRPRRHVQLASGDEPLTVRLVTDPAPAAEPEEQGPTAR